MLTAQFRERFTFTYNCRTLYVVQCTCAQCTTYSVQNVYKACRNSTFIYKKTYTVYTVIHGYLYIQQQYSDKTNCQFYVNKKTHTAHDKLKRYLCIVEFEFYDYETLAVNRYIDK